MACMSRKLVGSACWPMTCTSRAEPGTADTPAAPSSGLIFCFRNRFMNLANSRPEAVAMLKATAPRAKMPTDLGLRKTSPWVEAPTVRPR